MKKKVLKWLLIIVLVLVVLYFVHALITAKIYFDIYTAMKEKVNTSEEFYAKTEMPASDNYKVEQEIFIKDNVFVRKLTRTNKENENTTTLKMWEDFSKEKGVTGYLFIESTGENTTKTAYLNEDKEASEPEDRMCRYQIVRSLVIGQDADSYFYTKSNLEDYTYLKVLLGVIKHPTILYSKTIDGEKCYAIKNVTYNIGNYLYPIDEAPKLKVFEYIFALFNEPTEYISKETKLPVAADNVVNTGRTTLSYFSKEVTDEDIKLPNLEEYEIIPKSN